MCADLEKLKAGSGQRLRHLGVGLFSLLVISLIFSRFVFRAPEPQYAGKTVSQWLEAGHEDASFALHEIGPPALPYIFAKLVREDPRNQWRNSYRSLLKHLPVSIRGLLPSPGGTSFDETRGCAIVLELGPGTIPELVRALQNRNPVVRQVSAEALGVWRRRGKCIDVAVPRLLTASKDSDRQVALCASAVLAANAASAHE
ncbi:MAG TPA: hypothetical protein VL793_14125 [Patescibacteria group bacterium]|nr:hypothetical protein [Patescibacteria group bacterium]